MGFSKDVMAAKLRGKLAELYGCTPNELFGWEVM